MMNEEIFEDEQTFGRKLKLSDYLRIAYRGRWIILACFVVVFSITLYLTFTSPSIYQAGATILVESKGTMERSLFEVDYLGSQTTLITNQMEILKSRKLAERTARRLMLYENRDSLSLFRTDGANHVPSLKSMVGWLQGNMEIEHRKDTDVIEIKFQAESPFECAFITNIIAEEFKILNAETSQGEVSDLRNFLEKQVAKKEEELRSAEERLRGYQEKKKVANLDGETTQLVSRMAQAETMLEQSKIELNSAREKKKSLDAQIEERKATLGDDLGGTSTPYILSLQQQLGEAVAERTKFVVAIESQALNPNRLSYEGQLKVFDERINALRQKLSEESQKLTRSGMVKDALEMTQGLLTSLLETETEIKALTAKISALKEVVAEYDRRLETLPETTLELARFERDRKVQEETYIMMTSKLEETKIQQAGQAGNIRILDEAIEPGAPIRPNKRLNLLLGILIGLGLGFGVVFLIDYLDNTVRTIEEVEQIGLNLLGAIPQIDLNSREDNQDLAKEKGSNPGQTIETRLVTHFDPKSPISEAYRILRTNLRFTRVVNESLKTVLFTSAGPREGKSTTVANIAITLAYMGSKVVLVDSDLRRPVIHSIFGMEKENGLTNFMIDTQSFESILKPSFIENLSIVTCGVLPPNPSEILGSQKMDQFINHLKSRFDVILFDSPPVIAVTDAAVLSNKLDGAVLVISAGITDRDAIQRAKSLLVNVNARIIGAVLNNVRVDNTFGSSYYHYYHYYYDEKGMKPKKHKWGHRTSKRESDGQEKSV
jgi:capsular exopolysaccharide synthesis family protein